MHDAGSQRFSFKFDARYRPFLLALGVHPGNARVDVGADGLTAHFGRWSFATPFDNIRCVEITGPYRGYRAIGIRGSMVDHGITFGTSVAGGVCILLHEPIAALLPGMRPHPGITMTVIDLEGFAAAIAVRAGIDPPSA
jgi:hypothetical protein